MGWLDKEVEVEGVALEVVASGVMDGTEEVEEVEVGAEKLWAQRGLLYFYQF